MIRQGNFFVVLRILVLARRGSMSNTTKYDCKIKKHFGLGHIFQCSSILAKRKNAENQVISAFCSVLPFLIVTPEISGLYVENC